MIKKPTVYILCGVHNNLAQTKALLGCVKAQNYEQIKTVIVDDGSTDGTANYLIKTHPEIVIIPGDGNLWWTGAMFQGVKKIIETAADNDFILTVNNDCTFDSDYVQNLVETCLQNNRAITGSLVMDKEDKKVIWDAGVSINWQKGKIYGRPYKLIDELPKNRSYDNNIDTLSTKGTLYPVSTAEAIGNFDRKNLPHYLSDYEYACRAKKAGFQLVVSWRAIVYNDTRRTGLGDQIPRQLSYRQLYQLLFCRRSKQNIIDQWHFVQLCCPTKYKPTNYALVGIKFFYLLSMVFPFIIFRPVAVRLRRLAMKDAK